MQRDIVVLGMVMRIFLGVIAQTLQANSPGAAQANKAALSIGAVAYTETTFRWRILRAYVGRGLLEGFEAQQMLGCKHSGFSVDVTSRMIASPHKTERVWNCYCLQAHHRRA